MAKKNMKKDIGLDTFPRWLWVNMTSKPPPLVLNKEQFSRGYGRPAHTQASYNVFADIIRPV